MGLKGDTGATGPQGPAGPSNVITTPVTRFSTGSTVTLATVASMQLQAVCSAAGDQITFELNDPDEGKSVAATVGGNHNVVVNAIADTPAVIETTAEDRINFDAFDEATSTMDGQLEGFAAGVEGCQVQSAVAISGPAAPSSASASSSTALHNSTALLLALAWGCFHQQSLSVPHEVRDSGQIAPA